MPTPPFPEEKTPFFTFLFQRNNLTYLWIGGAGSLLLWILFKQFYPYPNIIWDSYYYIDAAVTNADVNKWPIGYSKFMRLIGIFSHNVNVLLSVQFFLLTISFLYFFFTFRFFFPIGKWATNILFVFLMINPIFFFISNLILSDTLFTAISILWFCQLLWIIFQPKPYMIFTHTLLVLIAFTVRYQALYYPIAASIFFILSRQPVSWKVTGIALQFVVIGGFIQYTIDKMEEEVGVKQFSPFGAWKLANNALYMYDHVKPDNRDSVPVAFRDLDQRVRRYFDSQHDKVSMLDIETTWGSYYMFVYPPSPLIEYQFAKFENDTTSSEFKKFAAVAPLFESYGNYLVRKYPIAFAQHVMGPDVILYFQPHPEVFEDSTGSMNMFIPPGDKYDKTREWFGITDVGVPMSHIKTRARIIAPYPTIYKMLHIIFLGSVFGFVVFKGLVRVRKLHVTAIYAIFAFWFCNFGFTVLSVGSVLRFQLFIIVIEVAFALLFLEYIIYVEGKKFPLLKE